MIKEGIKRKKIEEEKGYVRWLFELSNKDVAIAGGKGASLAEMFNAKMPVPPAFIVTAQAFENFISSVKKEIEKILEKTDVDDTKQLNESSKKIREFIEKQQFSQDMEQEILEAYETLGVKKPPRASEDALNILKIVKEPVFVAVRSSATTEDLTSISKDDCVLVKVDGKPFYDKISEIYNKFNNSNCEIEVPSMKNNEIVWAKAEQIYRHEANNVKLYKIETEKGRKIVVSPNHSLIIFDRDTLKPKTVTIDKLQNIDLVPAIANLPETDSKIKEIDILDYVNEGDIVECDNEIKIKNKSSNWKIRHGLKRKISLTNDFTYFLGLFVAEGCTYKNNEIIINNSNKKIINKIRKFSNSINLYPSLKINKHSLRVYCKPLVSLLHALTGKPLDKVGKGRSCYIKKVPNFVFGCKKELIASFLQGCFDGDGYVGKNSLSYTSTSEMLIGGIVKLLEIIGIGFFLNKKGNHWKISVTIHDSKKFKEQIGFTDYSKLKKLNKLINLYNEKKVYPKFKDNLFISEIFSKLLREKPEVSLPKEKIKITLCLICNRKIEKTSYYKNKLRYYCKNCKKVFYEDQIKKKEVETHINYDNKDRFTSQSIPWNKQRLFKKRFTKRKFKELMEKYNLTEFSNLFNSSIDWDQIKKITPISYSDYIYDFTVPEIENFAAGIGGIITHNTASFAGQQESFLNIKGKEKLLEAVKKCFSSLYTPRAIYYREKRGFKHVKALLAVVVQRMIDSEKSGVMFTKNPIQENDNVIVEAVFGLGEGIVGGKIRPDNYTVSRKIEILEKKIADKKKALIRSSSGETEEIKLIENKSKQQVLTDSEIERLADTGLRIEKHYKKPQDIEFAIENRQIYIVQSRPITTTAKRGGMGLEGKVLLHGSGASPGIRTGKVKIIREMRDLEKIQKGDILVAEMTNPDMVVTMQKCDAIVTDEGGMTCHAAIVSREMGIPAVVGTKSATSLLKENQIITVDGSTGKVYEGEVGEEKEEEILPIVETKTKIKVILDLPDYAERAAKTKCKDVGLLRLEGIIAESGKHPLMFLVENRINIYSKILEKGIEKIAKYFNDIWIRASDIRSDEFRNLQGSPKEQEVNPMLGFHGIRFSLKNKEILEAELQAIKNVAEKFPNKKLGIMFPQVISVEETQEARKLFEKFKTENMQFGIMIETPAAVQIIEEVCKIGIDFVSFGTNDLTQYTLAIDRGNENVQYLYNEMHPAVLRQIEQVIKTCKEKRVETSICGQAASRKEMVKFLIEKGIDSISVNADAAQGISKFVQQLESGLIEEIKKEEKPAEEETAEEKKEFPDMDIGIDVFSPQTKVAGAMPEITEDTIEGKAVDTIIGSIVKPKKEDYPFIDMNLNFLDFPEAPIQSETEDENIDNSEIQEVIEEMQSKKDEEDISIPTEPALEEKQENVLDIF